MSRPPLLGEEGIIRLSQPIRPSTATSILLRDGLVSMAGFFVAAVYVSLRQFHFLSPHCLVRNLAQDVSDDIQSGALLVIGVCDEPGCKVRICGFEHFV